MKFYKGVFMKFILIFSLMLSSLAVFADHHEGHEKGDFATKKAKLLTHLEEKGNHVEESKSCVSSATDDAALKACHEKMKAYHKANKEKRKAWKENRKKK